MDKPSFFPYCSHRRRENCRKWNPTDFFSVGGGVFRRQKAVI